MFGPVVAALGIFLVLFLHNQLQSWRLKALIGLAVGLFILAVGIDFVEGLENGFYFDVADFFSTSEEHALHFSKSIEEFFEMAGTTIFLFVFLKTLLGLTTSFTFQFGPSERQT